MIDEIKVGNHLFNLTHYDRKYRRGKDVIEFYTGKEFKARAIFDSEEERELCWEYLSKNVPSYAWKK